MSVRGKYKSWVKDDPRVITYMNDLACALIKGRISKRRAIHEALIQIPKLSTIPRSGHDINTKLNTLKLKLNGKCKECTPEENAEETQRKAIALSEIIPKPVVK